MLLVRAKAGQSQIHGLGSIALVYPRRQPSSAEGSDREVILRPRWIVLGIDWHFTGRTDRRGGSVKSLQRRVAGTPRVRGAGRGRDPRLAWSALRPHAGGRLCRASIASAVSDCRPPSSLASGTQSDKTQAISYRSFGVIVPRALRARVTWIASSPRPSCPSTRGSGVSPGEPATKMGHRRLRRRPGPDGQSPA